MGTLAVKVRQITNAPWRLMYTWDNEADKAAIETIEGGIVSASFVSFPLSVDIYNAIIDYIPNVRIEEKAREWYLKTTSTFLKANDTKSGDKATKRIALGLPYDDELYNFQTVGAKWLVDIKRGILADEPGLGKTITALAAADLAGAKKILVITLPGIVQQQWKAQAERWLKCTAVVAEGTQLQKLAALRTDARVKIISFHILADRKQSGKGDQNVYHEVLFHEKWDAVIIDEAHNLQNKDSKRAKNAARLRSDYLFLLTGTPLWNRVQSCWNLLHLLAPKTYSSYWTFVRKYCKITWTPFGEKVGDLKPSMLEAIQKELNPYMLRRTTQDVFSDLPEVVFTPMEYELTPDMYQVLREMKKKHVTYGGRDKHYTDSATVLTHMRKLCSYPASIGYDFDTPKTQIIIDTVREHLEAGRQILIFTWFRTYCEYLSNTLAEEFTGQVDYINGDVKPQARESIVSRMKSGKIKVLVATLPTLGVGVDLYMVDVAIFAEADWTPAMIEQGWRRVYRIGSKSTRFVYFPFARNTIEARIHAVFTKKQEVAEDVLLLESTT